ncbi:hypothetical protein AGOR_G00104300 [Albula goreensis]|uniref:Uncharacterized protein n=1 Tax=Albula goreensis TaxID=1534307 RepID=A0A8T3DDG8_9TELE|nr:hypothetical protein AGOR_G00104300 [Albula goreensis]
MRDRPVKEDVERWGKGSTFQRGSYSRLENPICSCHTKNQQYDAASEQGNSIFHHVLKNKEEKPEVTRQDAG